MSVPALRFKDDNGRNFASWQPIKIGNLGRFTGGGTPSTQNTTFWKGSIPWISSSDLSDEDIYKINTTRFITQEAISQSPTKLVPKNSILIVTRVGVGKVAITPQELCTSQDFTSLTLHSGSHVFFTYLIKIVTNKLLEFNQGTSIKGILKSDLEAMEVSAPNLAEQTKIANFLTAVDEKITQLTQKYDLLTQYKKGVMQQIFRQELRFKDDSGQDFPEWEEAPLRDVLDYEQPTKYLVSSTEYSDSFNTPVLTAGKTFILGYTDETIGICEQGLPVIIFDDFTTAFKFVPFPFKAKSSAMKILRKKTDVNIEYIYSAMQLIDFPSGDEHKRYWISEYSKVMIPLPCGKEQIKIANFLSALDDKITATQTQQEAVKQYKQSLLQQMFI